MRLESPTKVSHDHINIDVREIEPLLQGPASTMARWPGATCQLKDGRTLYITALTSVYRLRLAVAGIRPE